LLKEAVAGLPGAISQRAGRNGGVGAGRVSPIHGLYASRSAPPRRRHDGEHMPDGDRDERVQRPSRPAHARSILKGIAPALALLTLLAGLFMGGPGLARLGRFTRLSANSVMVCFLTGIAVNIVRGRSRSDRCGCRRVHLLTKALYVFCTPPRSRLRPDRRTDGVGDHRFSQHPQTRRVGGVRPALRSLARRGLAAQRRPVGVRPAP